MSKFDRYTNWVTSCNKNFNDAKIILQLLHLSLTYSALYANYKLCVVQNHQQTKQLFFVEITNRLTIIDNRGWTSTGGMVNYESLSNDTTATAVWLCLTMLRGLRFVFRRRWKHSRRRRRRLTARQLWQFLRLTALCRCRRRLLHWTPWPAGFATLPSLSVLLLNPAGVTNSGRRTARGACNTASKATISWAQCPLTVGAAGWQSLGERANERRDPRRWERVCLPWWWKTGGRAGDRSGRLLRQDRPTPYFADFCSRFGGSRHSAGGEALRGKAKQYHVVTISICVLVCRVESFEARKAEPVVLLRCCVPY